MRHDYPLHYIFPTFSSFRPFSESNNSKEFFRLFGKRLRFFILKVSARYIMSNPKIFLSFSQAKRFLINSLQLFNSQLSTLNSQLSTEKSFRIFFVIISVDK